MKMKLNILAGWEKMNEKNRVRLRQSCSDRAPSELCAPESALPIYTEQKIVTEVQNLLAKRSYFKF